MGDFSLEVISSPLASALPPPVAGIDVNFCKNPTCRNFGISAFVVKYRRTAGTALAVTPGTAYTIVATGKRRPALKCLLCGEMGPPQARADVRGTATASTTR